MAQFVVLEPEDTQNLEQAVFVRDGFHVWALVLPFVWLLAQRLWFEAFAVVGVTILLGLVATHFGIEGAVPVLTLLMSLFAALEGANWKIARLRRRGFSSKRRSSMRPIWKKRKSAISIASKMRASRQRRLRTLRTSLPLSLPLTGRSSLLVPPIPHLARPSGLSAIAEKTENACCNHRLRLRQSALGHQGF